MNKSLNKEEQTILDDLMKAHREVYPNEIQTDALMQSIYAKLIKKI